MGGSPNRNSTSSTNWADRYTLYLHSIAKTRLNKQAIPIGHHKYQIMIHLIPLSIMPMKKGRTMYRIGATMQKASTPAGQLPLPPDSTRMNTTMLNTNSSKQTKKSIFMAGMQHLSAFPHPRLYSKMTTGRSMMQNSSTLELVISQVLSEREAKTMRSAVHCSVEESKERQQPTSIMTICVIRKSMQLMQIHIDLSQLQGHLHSSFFISGAFSLNLKSNAYSLRILSALD